MATRKRIDRASSVIMKNIVVISFISSILNTVLLCISASKETWMFGDVSCQIHAIVCYVLLSSIAWLTSLAAIERLYKCLSSGSYSMTFSEINTRILIFGMYMTAFFLCTGPMYGWGEYSQFKGLLMIKVRLLSRHTPESTDLCNTTLTKTDAENIQYFGQLITSSLQEKWNMYIRSMNTKCDIHFTVRIRDVPSLTVLLEDVESQQTGNILYDLITHLNNNVTERYTPEIIVDRSNMHNYKNVLLPFQSLGVCTLDFSSVNDYKKSATYYIFGTTLILPFAVTAACGLVVLMNHYSGSLPDNIVNFKIIYFGSLLSFICCFPYYVINFMNGSGHFIPRHANFVSTFFFYNSSLCLTIPYLLYRRPKCRKSTKSTKNAHSYSNSNGIQEDIQMEQEYSKVDYV
ncbi:uncharacterized protein [Mytilus edulis]|uniref:uncharacterized protein n=1 Tax=Mytilus edulis TaxID=6550 RepID=UPI0039EE0B1F